MIIESEIRDQLKRFINGEISRDAFTDWLVIRSWDMHKDSSGSAQKLVHEIEARLYWFEDDLLDEKRLFRELRLLL